MAKKSYGKLNTYDSTANREDLLDLVSNTQPQGDILQGVRTGYTSSATGTTYANLNNTIQVYDSEFGKSQITLEKKKEGEDLSNLLESLLPYGRIEK